MKIMMGILVGWLFGVYLAAVVVGAQTLMEGETPVVEAVWQAVRWPLAAAVMIADHDLAHHRGAQLTEEEAE